MDDTTPQDAIEHAKERGKCLLNDFMLEQLPESLFETNITRLNLQGNLLASLPGEFRKLAHLEELILQNNKFAAFPLVLCECKQLRLLDISWNTLCDLPIQMALLVELTYLDLRNNQFSSIPPVLGLILTLEDIKISGNNFHQSVVEHLNVSVWKLLSRAREVLVETWISHENQMVQMESEKTHELSTWKDWVEEERQNSAALEMELTQLRSSQSSATAEIARLQALLAGEQEQRKAVTLECERLRSESQKAREDTIAAVAAREAVDSAHARMASSMKILIETVSNNISHHIVRENEKEKEKEEKEKSEKEREAETLRLSTSTWKERPMRSSPPKGQGTEGEEGKEDVVEVIVEDRHNDMDTATYANAAQVEVLPTVSPALAYLQKLRQK